MAPSTATALVPMVTTLSCVAESTRPMTSTRGRLVSKPLGGEVMITPGPVPGQMTITSSRPVLPCASAPLAATTFSPSSSGTPVAMNSRFVPMVARTPLTKTVAASSASPRTSMRSLVVRPAAGAVMWIRGGVRSMVKVRVAVPVWFSASVAVTSTTCGPSAATSAPVYVNVSSFAAMTAAGSLD